MSKSTNLKPGVIRGRTPRQRILSFLSRQGPTFVVLMAGVFFIGAVYRPAVENDRPVQGSIQFHSGYLKKNAESIRNDVAAITSSVALSGAAHDIEDLRLGLFQGADPVQALQRNLRVQIEPRVDRLEIGLSSPYPHEAAVVINTVIQGLVTSEGKTPPLIDPATVAQINTADPDSPLSGFHAGAGLMIFTGAGIIMSLALVARREFFDRRVRSDGSAETTTGLPVIGNLPPLSPQLSAVGRGLASYIDPRGESAQQSRSTWTRLLGENLAAASGSFLVTSPERGDGRSTVALNLAATLALAGVDVVLVDADVESPTLHKLLGCRGSSQGLGVALDHPSTAANLVESTHVPRLHFLSCGKTGASTMAKLGSTAMANVLSSLREKYPCVIVEAGPARQNSATLELGSKCDATLLVLHAGKTKLATADKCRQLLQEYGVGEIVALVNAHHKTRVRVRPQVPSSSSPQATDEIEEIYRYGWFQQKTPA